MLLEVLQYPMIAGREVHLVKQGTCEATPQKPYGGGGGGYMNTNGINSPRTRL